LAYPPRAVDPAGGVLFQRYDALLLAPHKRLLGGAKVSFDAPLHIAIPAPGEE